MAVVSAACDGSAALNAATAAATFVRQVVSGFVAGVFAGFEVCAPLCHQCSAFLEQVASGVGAFGAVADVMCQSGFGDRPWCAGLFQRPGSESAAETVHGRVDTGCSEGSQYRGRVDRLVFYCG